MSHSREQRPEISRVKADEGSKVYPAGSACTRKVRRVSPLPAAEHVSKRNIALNIATVRAHVVARDQHLAPWVSKG
jgi:hypothetical protein